MLISMASFIRTATILALLASRSAAQPPKNGVPSTLFSTQADFAMSLLRSACQSGEPSVVASVVLSASLAMCASAARGETQTEIINAIANGFSTDVTQTHISTLLGLLRNSTDDMTSVRLANVLLTRQREGLKGAFVDFAKAKFAGDATSVDCANVTGAVQEANSWVRSATEERLGDIIDERICSTSANEVTLLSAMSLTGSWEHFFKADETFEKQFFQREGVTKTVQMMPIWAFGIYRYAEDADVQMLGIPYKGSETFLYIFLPRERYGLATVEKDMTGKKLLGLIRAGEIADVEVEVPKFAIRTNAALSTALRSMGILSAFGETADFSAMSDDNLHISEVFHSTFFEVSENGTETVPPRNEEPPLRMLWQGGHLKFVADHPFMFAVVKQKTNVLLVGHYA